MTLTDFSNFFITEKYYIDLTEYISVISKKKFRTVYQRKKNGGYYVYNIPCSFDIETSSFYVNDEKQAIMYVWQFNLNGFLFVGRTWNEFIKLLSKLQNVLHLSGDLVLYCYVHNLSYEFQFMRKWIKWENVFSTETRNPIKAMSEYGIEFRDSYILSGYSLEMTAKQLHTYKVNKQVGLLDYEKIRTSDTPLTNNEIKYCIYDVIVVCAYIQEQIEEYGNITKIPLTQTGKVRNFCRKKCFYGFSKDKNIQQQNYYDYRYLMSCLTLSDNEYKVLKLAFMGGFTHANSRYVGDVINDVSSYDFTSSYPYTMLSELYPMGKGFNVNIKTIDDFNKYANLYCMVMIVKFINVSPKIFSDNPISISRCIKCENPIENNGRIVYADEIITACTNVDLETYLAFYNIEHIEISDCYCYAKDYLPRNFILSILKLYNDKTKLKGVKGSEKEYLHSKEMLNSCYGMCVTDIFRDEIIYSDFDEWETEHGNLTEQIDKYNKSKNRFLFYPWGVFVTAYARRNLFSGIKECSTNGYDDYIYSDTDSVKIVNKEQHKEYFNLYNKSVEEKLKEMCEYRKIPFELCKPKTITGKEKLIGVWDYEGDYKQFKTLGAKRYIYLDSNNELHSTVAGVSKTGFCRYLLDTSKNMDNVFKRFNNGLVIPDEYTGKMTHTYIDDEMSGDVIDYLGNTYSYYEKSGIHLSKTNYELSMSRLFIDFLRGVKTKNAN